MVILTDQKRALNRMGKDAAKRYNFSCNDKAHNKEGYTLN